MAARRLLTAHRYNLSRPDLELGISHLASASALRSLQSTLEQGDAVSIGLLGASVGQDAGCLDQPGRRCNDYSGRIRRPHRGQPYFAGFLVRFLHSINATWPHASHTITNGAADGTPPQSILDCLFSHLPRNLDLVILEFGSMARDVHMPSVEALLRVLLGQPRRPLIIFLTVREWCRADKIAFGSRARPFLANESTTWSRAEAKFDRLCTHYDLSCLSYYKALAPGFHAGRAGFGYDDIAADCLHPLSGRYGTAVMTDLLVFWLEAALARVDAARTAARALPPPALPSPDSTLFDSATVAKAQATARNAACYSLLEGGDRFNRDRHLAYQRLRPNPWVTAYCVRRPAVHAPLSAADSGCTSYNRHVRCVPELVRAPPSPSSQPVWLYCFQAFRGDGTLGKKSPGVLALQPGATLEMPVDTRLHDAFNERRGAARRNISEARLTAKLLHLTSYNSMGRIELSCHFGCVCTRHVLDAHHVSYSERNVSVFKDHLFDIFGGSATCVLRARVLRSTSSGGHKFKLRFLTITAAGAGANEAGVASVTRPTKAPSRAPSKQKHPALRPGDHEEVLP